MTKKDISRTQQYRQALMKEALEQVKSIVSDEVQHRYTDNWSDPSFSITRDGQFAKVSFFVSELYMRPEFDAYSAKTPERTDRMYAMRGAHSVLLHDVGLSVLDSSYTSEPVYSKRQPDQITGYMFHYNATVAPNAAAFDDKAKKHKKSSIYASEVHGHLNPLEALFQRNLARYDVLNDSHVKALLEGASPKIDEMVAIDRMDMKISHTPDGSAPLPTHQNKTPRSL